MFSIIYVTHGRKYWLHGYCDKPEVRLIECVDYAQLGTFKSMHAAKIAACADACRRMVDPPAFNREWDPVKVAAYDAFRAALRHDNGYPWDHHLHDADFDVLQAV